LGKFISILTFPGVIIHELSHEFFCRMLGVRVKKVCYFRLGNPAGYVIHESSNNFYQAFLIAIGPLLAGTFLSMAAFTGGKHQDMFFQKYVLIWLGVSIAVNCMPSKGDAKSLWLENWFHFKRNVLAILGLPFTAAVWVVSAVDSIWLRFFYACFLFFITW